MEPFQTWRTLKTVSIHHLHIEYPCTFPTFSMRLEGSRHPDIDASLFYLQRCVRRSGAMFQEFIRCLLCVASFHQIDSNSSQVVCDWLSARAEETSIAGQRIEPCEESQNAEKGHIALTRKACHSQSFVGFCSSGFSLPSSRANNFSARSTSGKAAEPAARSKLKQTSLNEIGVTPEQVPWRAARSLSDFQRKKTVRTWEPSQDLTPQRCLKMLQRR